MVARDVPLLTSKSVLKRLGAVVDLDLDQLIFRRLGNVAVKLLHLSSGHIAIRLLDPSHNLHHPTECAIAQCRK